MSGKIKETKESILSLIIALLLLLPPFFRGLFFDYPEFLTYQIFLTLVIILFIYIRKKIETVKSPLDLSLILLIIVYFISIFNAVNLRNGVGATLKVTAYFGIYWLLSNAVRSINEVKKYLLVIYTAGVGVALAGLSSAIGFIEFKGAFADGVIQTTLQYKNTGAIYVTAIFMIGLYLRHNYEKTLFKVLFGIGNFLLFLTLIGTESRGAWMVFPLVFILFLIGMPGKKKFTTIMNFILVFIPAVLLSSPVIKTFGQEKPGMGILWLIVGAVFTGGLQIGYEYGKIYLVDISRKKLYRNILLVFLAVILIFVIGFTVTGNFNDVAQKVLPEKIIAKVKAISFKERNLQERFVFYRDALKMIGERPVLGWGGGGWKSAYKQFRSYGYNTSEVHNHFLQVGVETGMPGLIIFIFIWLSFFYLVYRFWRTSGLRDERSLVWTLFIGAFTLGIHSLIDFNLSLGAVALLLWSLFGLARGVEKIVLPEQNLFQGVNISVPHKAKIISVYVLAAVLFLFSSSLFLGGLYRNKGAELTQNYQVDESISFFKKAVFFDPFNAGYWMDLASVYRYLAVVNKAPNMSRIAADYGEAAIKREPYEPGLRAVYSTVVFASGNVPLAVKEAEYTIKLDPYGVYSYENLAKIYLGAGNYYNAQGNEKKAKEYWTKVLGIPEIMKGQMEKLSPDSRELWATNGGAKLEVRPQIQQILDEANNLLR